MAPNHDREERRFSSRRSILRGTAGVAGGLVVGAAAAGSASAAATDSSSEDADAGDEETDPTEPVPDHAAVVDVEAEPSIDADGDLGAEIQAYCDGLETIDHAFLLPDGTYSWNTMVDLAGSRFFGLVGDGRPTLEVREFINFPLQLGWGESAFDELVVRNVVVDIDATDQYGNEIDAGVCNAFASDEALIEDVELVGSRQRYHDDARVGGRAVGDYHVVGQTYTVRLDVVDRDGEGVVRNVRLPDGAVHTYGREEQNLDYGEGTAFCSDGYHAGTIRWEDCYAEGYLGNSFYMWSNEETGTNVLEGCEVVDGYRTALRLGRNDEAYDCTVTYADLDPDYHENTAPSGLWLGEGSSAPEEQHPYAENVTIEAADVPTDGRGNLVRVDDNTPGGRIAGLEVVSRDDNGAAILSSRPSSESNPDPVRIEDFSVTESSTDGTYYGLRVSRDALALRRGSFAFGGRGNGIRVLAPGATLADLDVHVTNGETGLRLDTGDVELVDTTLRGEPDEPTTLYLGTDFDLESATLRGNAFEHVDLVDNSGENVTLADLEGGH